MILKALAENTAVSDAYGCEHGLSLYLETRKHKLLFDMGKTDLFLQNAEKLGVRIPDVDTAFLSHGHYDHGGGLGAFMQANPAAKVYAHRRAFEKHYSRRPGDVIAFIGLNERLRENPRIVLVDEGCRIDDELELFCGVTGRELFSLSNRVLLMECGGELSEDSFAHEQNLIITENDKTVLLAGCAHNGIVNIVKRFRELKGRMPDVVVGGFHLSNPGTGQSESPELVDAVAEALLSTGALYYTCHCTGAAAYERLRKTMGDRVRYLATGAVVEI